MLNRVEVPRHNSGRRPILSASLPARAVSGLPSCANIRRPLTGAPAMPTANDILAQKGFSVHVVSPGANVLDAVERMNQLRVGAVVVMDQGQVKGMFTERDVLMRVVGERKDPTDVR